MTSQTPEREEGQPRSLTGVITAIVAVLALGALGFAIFGTGGRPIEVGQAAPTFRATTLDGQTFDTAASGEQIVVVNFFASWCEPCQLEADELTAIYEEYRGRGVSFIGISYQDVDAKVREFIDTYGVTFPIARDEDGIARKFRVTGVPETYVIGRDGLIKYKQLGAINPAELRQTLEDSLQ